MDASGISRTLKENVKVNENLVKVQENILRELRIKNLLSTINMMEDSNDKQKILAYIYDNEISKLKLNVVLFPPEEETKSDPLTYNFHSVR